MAVSDVRTNFKKNWNSQFQSGQICQKLSGHKSRNFDILVTALKGIIRGPSKTGFCEIKIDLTLVGNGRHGLGKHTKIYQRKKLGSNQVQQGSKIFNPRTGLVVRFYPSTRTLDRTSVRFWKVQVRTLVRNRTAASLFRSLPCLWNCLLLVVKITDGTKQMPSVPQVQKGLSLWNRL